jgi:hypothetical protein
MKDYANQNWRQPDPEIEGENEFAGIAVAVFVGFMLGAVAIGWWVA